MSSLGRVGVGSLRREMKGIRDGMTRSGQRWSGDEGEDKKKWGQGTAWLGEGRKNRLEGICDRNNTSWKQSY